MGMKHMLAVNEVAESIARKKSDCVSTKSLLATQLFT